MSGPTPGCGKRPVLRTFKANTLNRRGTGTMGAIDADAHVIECERTFEFLEPEFTKYRPLIVATRREGESVLSPGGLNQREFWFLDNRMLPKEGNIGHDTPRESREMEDIGARLAHMDQLGVDVQVLYPTVFLRPWTQTPEVEIALCRCYNRWLAHIWHQAPERLRWVVMPHLLHMEGLREELEFARENGAVGIYMHGIEHDAPLYAERFHPIYAMAEELDLPICFHAGNNSFLLEGMYREDSGFAKAKLPLVATCHQLLMKGLPARFPKLRWAFVEVSAQWVPYALNDLAIRFRRRGEELSPTVMADNNIYVACQVTDDLDYVLKYTGESQLIVGTDYGHADTATEIEAMQKLSADGKLPANVVAKILEDNARTLYGL